MCFSVLYIICHTAGAILSIDEDLVITPMILEPSPEAFRTPESPRTPISGNSNKTFNSGGPESAVADGEFQLLCPCFGLTGDDTSNSTQQWQHKDHQVLQTSNGIEADNGSLDNNPRKRSRGDQTGKDPKESEESFPSEIGFVSRGSMDFNAPAGVEAVAV